ncbi:hypothetical protein [Methanoculleus chikugoensis]|uniref:hypothetical protein n=1 Tax=Methanoculleus chikugoensis TaxID=118126 RepID=UPI001FB24695|nr:hypothetical protein [Methanoculleus chikugoensis]
MISSCPGTGTFPSVEAIVIDFPLLDAPELLCEVYAYGENVLLDRHIDVLHRFQ